ncbi:MAG: Trm112 family protein [Desulfovibrionaceae bacterium]|nr:Trm112 family protein [Desulfovibrionaceae bacterium]
MNMNKELLEILACPRCHGALEALGDNADEGLSCPACAVVYPVRDDIPVMLVEEAVPLADWQRGQRQAAR